MQGRYDNLTKLRAELDIKLADAGCFSLMARGCLSQKGAPIGVKKLAVASYFREAVPHDRPTDWLLAVAPTGLSFIKCDLTRGFTRLRLATPSGYSLMPLRGFQSSENSGRWDKILLTIWLIIKEI